MENFGANSVPPHFPAQNGAVAVVVGVVPPFVVVEKRLGKTQNSACGAAVSCVAGVIE